MNYFAYGSNMNVRRMKERKITFSDSERCAAHLCGYHLEFNKVANDNPLMGYANIVLDGSGLVEGVLYNIDAASLPILDDKEKYPKHYLKIPIKVLLPSDGKEVCAITYIANPDKIRDGLKPCRDYLNHLLEGRDFLSKGYLEWLEGTETLPEKTN